jgi:hypothetical protein
MIPHEWKIPHSDTKNYLKHSIKLPVVYAYMVS